MDEQFQWVTFYEEFADKLHEYINRKDELFEIMKKLQSEHTFFEFLHFENDEWWSWRNYHVDPFTVMAVMNRGLSDRNRTFVGEIYAEAFDIKAAVPMDFSGIPVVNNMSSFFNDDTEENLWTLFEEAIEYDETKNTTDEFVHAFNEVLKNKGNGLARITMGLYWIRPRSFMPLDSNSRKYLPMKYQIRVPAKESGGKEYFNFLQKLKTTEVMIPFYKISYDAWLAELAEKEEKNVTVAEESSKIIVSNVEKKPLNVDKNIILYGPPGTGKTYSSVLYAVSIIEEMPFKEIQEEEYYNVYKRYLEYKEDGLIDFVTFHQSFSYEEFIEGIRPVVTSEEDSDTGNEIEYEISDGLFKKFSNRAETPIDYGMSADLGIHKNPSIWKISLSGNGDNEIRKDSMDNNHIRIGWDEYGEEVSDSTDFSKIGGKSALNAFYNEMKIGDIVLSAYSNELIDAIGVVTGEPEWHDEYPTYKRQRSVDWLAKDLSKNIADINAGKNMTRSTLYKLTISVSDVMRLLREMKPELFSQEVSIPNRVFIIDEINRGNISKIFGELITLIEPSKRINAKEEMRTTLPYSGQKFGVPDNVYIIGTMNTADRSIAMLDTALRRRFSFNEMIPNPELLKGIKVEGIDIERLLELLNKRITILFDRDHTIGHSYFLPLKNNPTIEHLGIIFENRIIPLLQEYFYDNYERIRLILGDNQKTIDEHRFITQNSNMYDLFGDADIHLSEYYSINQSAFKKVEAYEYLQ